MSAVDACSLVLLAAKQFEFKTAAKLELKTAAKQLKFKTAAKQFEFNRHTCATEYWQTIVTYCLVMFFNITVI